MKLAYMENNAVITNFTFSPMEELDTSKLQMEFLTEGGEQVHLEFNGSVQDLSKRFDFVIAGDHNWDFTGLIDRKCILSKDEGGYHFESFV